MDIHEYSRIFTRQLKHHFFFVWQMSWINGEGFPSGTAAFCAVRRAGGDSKSCGRWRFAESLVPGFPGSGDSETVKRCTKDLTPFICCSCGMFLSLSSLRQLQFWRKQLISFLWCWQVRSVSQVSMPLNIASRSTSSSGRVTSYG